MHSQTAQNLGLLRSWQFDGSFILGIPLLAIASGFLVAYNNDLFLPVLAADLWILGYHHVIATYTRLAFDVQSFRENRALIFYLFPAVALGVILLAVFGGAWVVSTVYLYWQWWHYTRQSEGISKAYRGKSREMDHGNPYILRAAFYAVPVTAILAVSHRGPTEFLFFPLRTLPVPDYLLFGVASVSAVLVILWIIQLVKAYLAGKLAVAHTTYVLSHFLVYYVAYIHIENINYGWLTINIWHNAQYILFVWLFNNRRFQGKPSETQRFLSTISQNGRFLLYMATCLAISTLVYFLISRYLSTSISAAFAITTTMSGLIIYQTINFHHYIVDSLIWKLRKPKIRQNLGLT